MTTINKEDSAEFGNGRHYTGEWNALTEYIAFEKCGGTPCCWPQPGRDDIMHFDTVSTDFDEPGMSSKIARKIAYRRNTFALP